MGYSRDAKKWIFTAASDSRKRVLDLAKKVSASSCPVLIIGPTGVGKEVLAEDIHTHSPRAAGRFVAINCAALTPTLFESELFGHHRGAYTGAVARKLGLVELADGGTLFLDEVGELPLEIQAKLLRFLARGTFWSLGGTEERSADVRVIAATNRNLRKMIPSLLREDLFYRLSVAPVVLPPLEPDDTRVLCVELGREIARLRDCATSPEELDALARLAAGSRWPGGVRELRSVLERYFLLRERESTVEQTWETSCALGFFELPPPAPATPPPANAAEVLRRFEDVVFLALAKEAKGVRELAQRLDRTPQAVYDRLKKLGVSPDDLRGDKLATLLVDARDGLTPYQGWIQAILNG